MNPLEGLSIDRILQQIEIWLTSNQYPWSYIQEVVSYYRPDLNNKEFYDYVGQKMDESYEGDWTNEDINEDFDFEQEPDWDKAALEGRERNEEEIQTDLGRLEDEREKEKTRKKEQMDFDFGKLDSNGFLNVPQWGQSFEVLTPEGRRQFEARVAEDRGDFDESAKIRASEITEQERAEAADKQIAFRKWWDETEAAVKATEERKKKSEVKPESRETRIISSSPTPQKMTETITKLRKEKFVKPGIFQ